jgi:muconolactone delta-isomerase
MKYLVSAVGGPSFSSPEEAAQLLEHFVLPSLEKLAALESEKKILAGGCPVGERALIFIIEASSNEELDQLLMEIPLWVRMEWEVTPLQSFEKRAGHAKDIVRQFKK